MEIRCEFCETVLVPFDVPLEKSLAKYLARMCFKCVFCKASFTGDVFKGAYSEYLKSSQWRAVRKAAIARADGRCQVCNSDLMLQVHHRKYPEFMGIEDPFELTVLCRRCHDLFHNVRPRI
jgi:hypothetical protein